MMERNILRGKKKFFFIFLYLSDIAAFFISVTLGSLIMAISLEDPFYMRYFLFTLLMLVVIYTNHGLYNNKRSLFDDTDIMHIVYSAALTFIILLIFNIMFNPQDIYLLIVTIFILVLTVLTTILGRLLLSYVIYVARKRGYDIKKTIYFGEEDKELIEKLKDKQLGYNLIAYTDAIDVLKKKLKNAEIIFVKMESIDDELLEIMVRHSQINWKIISSVLNLVIEPIRFDEFKDYPIINISNKDENKLYMRVKRIIDIIVSGAAIIVLLPLFIIVALLIKMTMPGPIFFWQYRLGKDLKRFRLYKFRSMKVDAEKEKPKLSNEVNGLFKMKKDPRTTAFGRILRRTCIDELPQLINVFLGHMSLVGPRPHLRAELQNFEGWRKARFRVKPGLTGMWQVSGRHELNFDKAVLYDIYYVNHVSFMLDLKIILKTIPMIIMSKGRF